MCKKLKEHAIKIINYKNKEMIPLNNKENKSYKEQKTCHICKEKFCMDNDDEIIKIGKKLKITAITRENLEELPIVNAT